MPSPKNTAAQSANAQGNTGSKPVIIKKYANRRLYDTESSSYITLEHLAAMTRAGKDFKVVDAKSGDDITHNVLTQIIVEEENRGTTLLPVNFLRQLISMYGDQMQSMVPHYLEASMEAFRRNQEQARNAMMGVMAGGANPFEALARQNMAMMKAAADMWVQPGRSETTTAYAASQPAQPAEPFPTSTSAPSQSQTDTTSERDTQAEDLKALKAELLALKTKIEKLTD